MSKKPALTAWIDGSVKPVRQGTYQRRVADIVFFAHWDGESWCRFWDSAWYAGRERRISFEQNAWPWRGLAADPKGGK